MARLRFKDTVKRNMNNMDIDKSTWKEKAKSRDGWRSHIRPKWRQSLSHRQTDDDDDDDDDEMK